MELPSFVSSDDSPTDEPSVAPPDDEPCIRPLSELVLEEQAQFVVEIDDENVERPTSPLSSLAPTLEQAEPLTWFFTGARLTGDATLHDGRLLGEWFAEEWRAESGRSTDLVIDATWPECTLTLLKSHLKSRVTNAPLTSQ